MASSTNSAQKPAPSYLVDAGTSRFEVRASAIGLLSAFGHSPTVAIRRFTGEAWFRSQSPEMSSLRLEIDPSSLVVTGETPDKDRREMERTMQEEVLQTWRFSQIRFESSSCQATRLGEGLYRMRIFGKLTLHGVQRDLEIPCNVVAGDDFLRANGEFSIRQTNFGIRLVSAAGGTIRLKDELKFRFDIVARRFREPGDAQNLESSVPPASLDPTAPPTGKG
jgi:polyisoprenoid-binding protein YceI